MIQGAARSGKDKIMHFRKIAAGAAAIMMALVCGCSVRSSSDEIGRASCRERV